MRKRKISEFMCKELLYDYATGQLDNNRKYAVKEYLESDAEMRIELQSIEFALSYLDELKKTEISKLYLDKLNSKKTNNIANLNSKTLKYVRNLSALFLLCLLLGNMFSSQITKFLNRFDSDTVILAEIKPERQQILVDESVDESITESQDLVEEELMAVNDDGPESEPVVANPVTSSPESNPITVNPKNKKAESAINSAATSETDKAEVKITANKKGEVYWSFMKIKGLEIVSPNIVSRIEQLNGGKAGSVKLGWTKPNGRRYYHFKMPKKNYESMMNYLGSLGKLNIVRAPHRRIMPKGLYRFVLEIENIPGIEESENPDTGSLSE